jgi:hypothetical protein
LSFAYRLARGNRVGFHLLPLLVVCFPFWVTRRPACRGYW